MSYFDPHNIYKRKQSNSHKGQVIQAKPQPRDFGYTNFIDRSRFDKYISDLSSLGYAVYPPGLAPVPNVPFCDVKVLTVTASFSNVSLPRAVTINDILTIVGNSDIWPSSVFEPDVSSVENFVFDIRLNSAGITITTPDQASCQVNGSINGRGTFNFPTVTTAFVPAVNEFVLTEYNEESYIRSCDKSIDFYPSATTKPYAPLYQKSLGTTGAYESLKNDRQVPQLENSQMIYWGTPTWSPLETPYSTAGFVTCTLTFYTFCVDVKF